MPAYSITETVILYLKEGVNLDNEAFLKGANSSPEVQAFLKLTDTLKAQPGYMRQLWGPQVETPNIFIWSIDWATPASHTTFALSPAYTPFLQGVSQLFDVDKSAPLIIHTRWTASSTPAAAFDAPVTEIAFCTLPDTAGDAERQAFDAATASIGTDVKAVGKAWGSATGWVEKAVPAEVAAAAARPGESVALHGVFGYESVEAHMRWRETPEHARAVEIMGEMQRRLGLRDASVLGGGGMFHVRFGVGTGKYE